LKRFLTPLLVFSLGIFVSYCAFALGEDDVYPTATAALTGRAIGFSTKLESAGL
jgi:hypothetical protein